MDIISVNALITINETFFVQLISFLIFVFIFNRIMIKPLLNTVHERNSYMRGIKSMIKEKEEELVTFTKALDAKKAKIRGDAFSQARVLEDEANEIAAQIFKESKDESSKMRSETEKRVHKELKREKEKLEGQAEALTISIMEKILGRRLAG